MLTNFNRTLAYQISYFISMHRFKGSRFIRALVRTLLIPSPKGKAICKVPYGFSLIVDPIVDKGVERNIYFNGGYEYGTLEIMKKILDKDDVFIDVGSNVGLMTLAASSFVGSGGVVYSFEPYPETYQILSENLILNKTQNVRIYNLALGAESGKASIYSNMVVNRGSSSLLKPSHLDAKGEAVDIIALDEFIEKEEIKKIKMIKVDVEGWELEVFLGARKLLSSKAAPIICFEYSEDIVNRKAQKQDLYEYIRSVNEYHIFRLEYGKEYSSKLVPITSRAQLPKHDNLFCLLPVHLQCQKIKQLLKST